jgi:glutathione S-transferase
MAKPRFLLHFAPKSRASRILWLLEELRADFELVHHDLDAGTQKAPDFLAINPAGKLPVVEDRGPQGDWQGVVVTESLAICSYLIEAHGGALAPAVGTPERAAYQTWLAFGTGVLEPALADKAFPRAAPPPERALGWPGFDVAVARLETQLTASGGPYILGSRFTGVDVMIGSTLQWIVGWGMMTPTPAIAAWLAALAERPAMARVQALEAQGA